MEIQKTILQICMQKGFLLGSEMLELLCTLDESSAQDLIESLNNIGVKEKVITKDLFFQNVKEIRNILAEGGNKNLIEDFFRRIGYQEEQAVRSTENEGAEEEDSKQSVENGAGRVKLISSPAIAPKKITVKDFVKHFRARYECIKGILQERNLENLASIRKIGDRRENYTIIAAVLSKRVTKNKNLLLEVEDMTGTARILVSKNKNELFNKAKDLLLDDIVAFPVSGNSEWLFANDVIFPDSYLQERRTYDKEELVAFTSDLHIGSTMFLEKNVLKFIKWLNGEEGNEEQRELAKKVKYLFLVGDSIDGVGVFPDQDKYLSIKDIKEQYAKLVELLKLIRSDIKIILGPGQHDGVRVAEPQPIVEENWAPGLHKLNNLILVPNPALVEIDGGFKILMYHGASMHGIINEIDDIRLNYGHDSPVRVVKEMLKRRHLAPMHGSTIYIPNEKQDPLVISQIPDIVATGDQHRSEVSYYNNILLIASSCWQSITPFEEKVGNHPDYCKVPLFNLKTRQIKIMDFSDDPGEEADNEPN